MSVIKASLSTNYKEVTFHSTELPNEAWSKLVEVKNECGIPPYLYEDVEEFTVSWMDFLYLLSEAKKENIQICF